MYHAVTVEEVVTTGWREHGIGAVSQVDATESWRKLTQHLEVVLNRTLPNWGEVANKLNSGVEWLGEGVFVVQLVDQEALNHV